MRFWTVWKARNGITFSDDVLSIRRLRAFLFTFSDPTKLFTTESPSRLVGFIN